MLTGKIALVTGASKGIGRATVEVFLRNNAHVFISGRNIEQLNTLATALRQQHAARVDVLQLDVTDEVSVKVAFQAIFKQTKRLDILVNNAGILDDALIGMVTTRQIEDVFKVNSFGVLYCSQYASRLMARHGAGSIINISSIIGVNGNEGQAVYGGSKAAVIGITKSLAKELAPKNIRVNALAPGFIDTDMARSIPEDKFQERLHSIKMLRIGDPVEVANVALFLASDLSSYVTGQVVGVDGGMLI